MSDDLSLRILDHGIQWSNSAGQDYYENLNARATQYNIPVGWEDANTMRVHQAFK